MDDAASVILNGVEGRAPAFLLVKGSAQCEIVEQQANLVAFVNFDSVDDRGWPGEARPALRWIATGTRQIRTLQDNATRRTDARIAFARHPRRSPNVIESIEEIDPAGVSIWRWLRHRRRPKASA